MKTIMTPENGWLVCCADLADGAFLDACALSRTGGKDVDVTWYPTSLPTSVQDVLCENGVLPASARQGQADYEWVAEKDWIYLTRFTLSSLPENAYAEFQFLGIDTVASIYCNGELIGTHEDIFLRKTIPVSCLKTGENILTLYFRSPSRAAAQLAQDMPEDWKLVMGESRLLRKVPSDYSTFLGNQVLCTCVGLYGEVSLHIYPTKDRLTLLQADTDVSQDLSRAIFEGEVTAEGSAEAVRVSVIASDGTTMSSVYPLENGRALYQMELSEPLLWWPAGYGPQNLYTVKAELLDGETVLDVIEKRVGIRRVEYTGDFRFTINNQRIRLWGSNFANVEGITHWCDPARVRRLLELARDGNLNTMRIWGEGPLLPDLFYDLADELGILVWQDFGLGFGPWPDSAHYRELFRQEVEQMVLRLRHHVCLLIWCGSNETYMTGISEHMDGLPRYGFDMIFRDAQKICDRLDPRRLYIPTSPMGGNYPQDASGGDIHGYWGVDFEPGLSYPVLFSESCHATTYSKHSMLRFMTEEEIWPEGYQDTHRYDPTFFDTAAKKSQAVPGGYGISFQNYWRQISVPETWKAHLSCFAPSELWDLENYFSAHDADSMLYKFAVCGADFYKREVERIRRGRPCNTPFAPRRCSGYLTWKYNDAWPHINFTQIDYYLEPTAQYYAVKRACAPVVAGVSAEQDHLYLWAVNDSGEEVRGEIVLRLFSRLHNRVEREYTFPVWLRPDESRVVDCLDWMGSLHREQILHTTFTAADGTLIGTNVCYLDLERNLSFPEPEISLSWENGMLAVRTNQYARYVELLGESEDGDCFGWKFSDNYFDLLPFETKYIKVEAPCETGRITALPHFGKASEALVLEK